MAFSTEAMAVRTSVIFDALVLCCLALFITNTMTENVDVKLAGLSSELVAKPVMKRQVHEQTTHTTLIPFGEETSIVQTTKKPKTNTDKKNMKPKNTSTVSPARNQTDFIRQENETEAADMTTPMYTDEENRNKTLLFEPKNVFVYEGKTTNLTITYGNLRTELFIKLKNVAPSIYTIVTNESFKLLPLPNGENSTMTVTIKGNKLGITGLAIIVIEPNKPPPMKPTSVQIIKCMRIPRNIDKIFDYSLLPLVIVAVIGMGCNMEWTLIKTQLKRPLSISVGPLCQFILMPFFSFAIAKMVKLDPLVAFGLLIVGSCPGGGLSNMITLLVHADLIQSVVMTFVSTVFAIGMLPFNLWVYSRAFVPENGGSGENKMNLPLAKIIMQLVMLAFPLIIGITIRHKLPKVAYYLLKPLNMLSAFLVVSSLGVGIYSNSYVIWSPWPVLLSAFLLPVSGFTVGFLIGRFIARLPYRSAVTVSIETGIQNNLVAIAMIKFSFPQPEADLMARTPIFVALTAMSIGIGMIVVAIPINRRAARAAEGKLEEEPQSVDNKANAELPESPGPYTGYNYQPIPYEKAIAMKGDSKDTKTIDGSVYKTFHGEPEETETESISKEEQNGEDPLYVKMRKTSQETDI